jgi:predicted alpha/beta superfamily hydrolase
MTFALVNQRAFRIRLLAPLVCLTALLASALAPAQVAAAGSATAPVPLAIGETFTIESAVLGETRRINVYAAPAYGEAPEARRPVLYMPDGGLAEDFLHIAGLVQVSVGNGTMRPFLLVGIENTERRRDLTGPTTDPRDLAIAPRVGGSAAFRAFLRDELMPHIDAAYRTTGETAIVGESLAGLFAVESFLLEPGLFDTAIAIDPSLWWNGQELVDGAAARLDARPDLQAGLYLASSDEEGIANVAQELSGVLEAHAPAGLRWIHAPMPAEKHPTIYHPAALAAFRALLGP